MSNVVNLHDNYYATCSSCGSTSFSLMVDDVGDKWTKVIGTQCNECDVFIDWQHHKVRDDMFDEEA